MKDKLNSHFAVLIIILAGAGAVWLIIHVATANSFTSGTVNGSEASYDRLQQSILKQSY